MRSNKYTKLPKEPVESVAFGGAPLVLQFKQDDGRLQKITLTFFIEGKYTRPQIAKACAEVFWLCMQSISTQTRVNMKYCLRLFNTFLDWRAEGGVDKQIHTTLELSRSLFVEFQAYLEFINEKNKESAAAKSYHHVKRFFTHMLTVKPEYLPPGLRIPENPFRHTDGRRAIDNVISLEDLNLITEAATREVNEIRENRRRALELLESADVDESQARMTPKPRGFWESLANALFYLIRVKGILSGINFRANFLALHNHPPAPKLIGWYAPTSDEYFVPFLVLLYLRTAINVTSIFKLKRDCLAEHPLPLGLTVCRFTKPRSGPMSNKEQSFPTNQPGGAVELIKFLLEYTEPWIEHARVEERNALFLYYSRLTGVRSAGYTFTDASLSRFIARNNLPHFSLNQLRPTVATMVYLQTRDIFRVQRLLNHSKITTTIKYIRGAVVQAQYNNEMAQGIDAMVEAVTGLKKHSQDISIFTESASQVISEKIESRELSPDAGEKILGGGCNTLVGRCKDPLNSPQPGEIKGRICRSLHACLFCENCWIFAEDLIETIKYRNGLEAQRTEMTSEMWELLHRDAVREINESILTAFPSEVVAKAELDAKKADASS